ncbi:crystallin J1A [Patella vulgata]|uniref:crystallin J1A n=1 Tax=Patella vulgata TaxID=6465 RepID=UPI0021806583|nr:crystallin J1A [Patella vulgata]
MSTVVARRVAAVCGVFVGDAAAQPLHWIYDQKKLDDIIGRKEEVEFWPTSHNAFYTLNTGQNSGYGDQPYVILKSLVENKGLNITALNKATVDFFGPGTEYDNPNRPGEKPIQGRWLHKSLMDFLQNYKDGKSETGSADKSADCCIRMVPVVALYAGQPDMLERVRQVVQVTQNDELLIAAALAGARILENFILKGNNPSAVQEVIIELCKPTRKSPTDLDEKMVECLKQVLEAKDCPHTEVAVKFGRNCYVPGNLQTSLHAITTNDNFQSAVRSTIKAGGCNSSRSGYIGACTAAKYGLEAVPDGWKTKTDRYQEVLKLAQELVKISL